jgi:hypothetical protein
VSFRDVSLSDCLWDLFNPSNSLYTFKYGVENIGIVVAFDLSCLCSKTHLEFKIFSSFSWIFLAECKTDSSSDFLAGWLVLFLWFCLTPLPTNALFFFRRFSIYEIPQQFRFEDVQIHRSPRLFYLPSDDWDIADRMRRVIMSTTESFFFTDSFTLSEFLICLSFQYAVGLSLHSSVLFRDNSVIFYLGFWWRLLKIIFSFWFLAYISYSYVNRTDGMWGKRVKRLHQFFYHSFQPCRISISKKIKKNVIFYLTITAPTISSSSSCIRLHQKNLVHKTRGPDLRW